MAADVVPCMLGSGAHSADWFQCCAQLESWQQAEGGRTHTLLPSPPEACQRLQIMI